MKAYLMYKNLLLERFSVFYQLQSLNSNLNCTGMFFMFSFHHFRDTGLKPCLHLRYRGQNRGRRCRTQ